jgi:hypothetical protein
MENMELPKKLMQLLKHTMDPDYQRHLFAALSGYKRVPGYGRTVSYNIYK